MDDQDLTQQTKQEYQPIQTPIGTLFGRDAIFLDTCALNCDYMSLTLHGTINARLASRPVDREIAYTLTFVGILALKMVELDSWSHFGASSFDEVIHSNWIRELNGKVTQEEKHFQLVTYDHVFEVVCSHFRMTLDT
jgi:hypothetical protein